MSDALIDRRNVERLAQEFHDCDELPTTLLCLCDRIEKLEAKLAQQDDLVQAAVAAALREADEAVQSVASNCTTEDGHVAIIAAVEKVRSLITPDAKSALDRVVAARFGMVRAEVVRLSAEGKIDREAAVRLLAAIRKGEE